MPVYFVNALPMSGPRVDELQFHIYEGEDQQVEALLSGDVDLVGEIIDPTFETTLEEHEDIQIGKHLRNGYGYLFFNHTKYPYNITAFRRAAAFALDKEWISSEVWNGLAQPLDSPVPRGNPFSIEDDMSYSYYESKMDLASGLLDEAGFIDVNSDGYRDCPNGEALFVKIHSTGTDISLEICGLLRDKLHDLHIDADVFYDWWFPGLDNPAIGYDIYFNGYTFENCSLEWLANEYVMPDYLSKGLAIPRWENATYSELIEKLLHENDFEDIYEAAKKMQEIWVYECPVIIAYQNHLLTAHRTDHFSDFQHESVEGYTGWWTKFMVKPQEETSSEDIPPFRCSLKLGIDTFNFMKSSSEYASKVHDVLFDRLIRVDVNGNIIPWLAKSYTIETHSDNPSVPEGHSRFTFNLYENMSWSDGTPFTAYDIEFSYNYYKTGCNNPLGADLQDELNSIYAKTPFVFVAEFKDESYWHILKFKKQIIPKHIFEDTNPDSWAQWDPEYNSTTLVTTGPFAVVSHNKGDNIILEPNPYYFRRASVDNLSPTPTVGPWSFTGELYTLTLTVTSIAVTVVFLFLIIDNRYLSKRT